MSVLKTYFNQKVNQCSPIQVDYNRVVNYDEAGNELIYYEKVDYPALVKSNGVAEMWSLNNLLKAGINPNFPIKTGVNTRLDGVDEINKAAAFAEQILSESKDVDTSVN